jgi:hypothetical protein
MIGDCAEGCRLRMSDYQFLTLWCSNRGGKVVGLPDSLYGVPSTSWDTATISKTDLMIASGSAKAQRLKMKPASWVRAA